MIARSGMWAKSVCLALVVAIVFDATVVWAGLDDELAKMFQSWGIGTATVNQGGAYESQQRGFLSGGSVSVRVYRRPLPPLVSFSRPRFKLGCNGIDVYLGPFSYVKFERFIQLLQQLGLSAVAGFAFKLALKELCEVCSNVLDSLEAAIRSLNALTNLQPCQASIETIKNRFEQFGKSVGDLVSSVKTAAGEVSDKLEGFSESAKMDQGAQENTLNASDDTRVSNYNVVYDTLQEAGVDRDSIMLIMSVTGTLTVINGGRIDWTPGMLSVDKLVDLLPDEPVTIMGCGDGGDHCVPATKVELNPGGVTGFGKRVRDAMESIADKMIARNVILSDEEKKLINLSPVPLLVKLNEQSVTRQMMESYISQYAEMIAVQLAVEWIRFAVDEATEKASQLHDLYPHAAMDPKLLNDFLQSIKRVKEEAVSQGSARVQRIMAVHSAKAAEQRTSRGKVVREAYKLITQQDAMTEQSAAK